MTMPGVSCKALATQNSLWMALFHVSHPPGSKHGHSCLTYLWNQLKVIGMLNDRSRGYLQNCCYSKQLSMALLHASHSPAQTCGGWGQPIYIFFLIFPAHRVLDPITNPYFGPPSPPLAAPCCNEVFLSFHRVGYKRRENLLGQCFSN